MTKDTPTPTAQGAAMTAMPDHDAARLREVRTLAEQKLWPTNQQSILTLQIALDDVIRLIDQHYEPQAERLALVWKDRNDWKADAREFEAELTRLRSQVREAERVRAEALEAAASECLVIDREDAGDCPSGDGWVWYGKSRDHAAARIRALAPQPAPRGPCMCSMERDTKADGHEPDCPAAPTGSETT